LLLALRFLTDKSCDRWFRAVSALFIIMMLVFGVIGALAAVKALGTLG